MASTRFRRRSVQPETWIMCLSFTLEVTQWPILGQLTGFRGHGNAGHQLRWHQLSQSCVSWRDGCTKAALGPRSPWRFCEGSAGTGCSGGIAFQTLSFQRHTCLWLRSHGALCSYFPLHELPSKADILLAPSVSDQEDCPYVVKCLGSKENIQNTWVKRTSLNSHFPCFN